MVEQIITTYRSFLPCKWDPLDSQVSELRRLYCFSKKNGFRIRDDYDQILIEAVNQKLSLNSDAYKHILDVAFQQKVKLNYILKSKIKMLLDCADDAAYHGFLVDNAIYSPEMEKAFCPVHKDLTMEAFLDVFSSDKMYADIYNSIFSRFCFSIFERKCTQAFFSGVFDYAEDYFSFIETEYPDMCDRTSALGIIDVSPELFSHSYEDGCNQVLNAVRQAYNSLNNHCDLAVVIPPIMDSERSIQWKLYADIILFAEKHIKEKIDKQYFRWQKIAKQTTDYIERIVPYNAEFEYAFQGFVFKDCFVMANEDGSYSLLLILEKNKRDERVVNCPACCSRNIQGNSYPILNVRSWECENPLCPDRSKYNRGKRYAFMSLFRQKEMQEDRNLIPEKSISTWRLDCVRNVSKQDAFEMVIRHYSCVDDGILFFTSSQNVNKIDFHDRSVKFVAFTMPSENLLRDLKNSTYFYRFLHSNNRQTSEYTDWHYLKSSVFWGDSYDVIRSMPTESVDGAVTSPPYYNAKSYSQWPNIYCYLFDMYNISKEVYRVLKDGAVYLFNIFDYFDNENNIVLSAMGNKRMILGAYMIDIFERIGFSICGNIIWNKGEIQGNRSFNQGNLTPYYQAPLNCWEHVLILSKGKPNKKYSKIVSCIEDIRPVIKMVRGKNILGHDAPYPAEIPELLIRHMSEEDTVLDPFLGSGTTCAVANQYNVKSIGIERNFEYFQLCQKTLKQKSEFQLSLL